MDIKDINPFWGIKNNETVIFGSIQSQKSATVSRKKSSPVASIGQKRVMGSREKSNPWAGLARPNLPHEPVLRPLALDCPVNGALRFPKDAH